MKLNKTDVPLLLCKSIYGFEVDFIRGRFKQNNPFTVYTCKYVALPAYECIWYAKQSQLFKAKYQFSQTLSTRFWSKILVISNSKRFGCTFSFTSTANHRKFTRNNVFNYGYIDTEIAQVSSRMKVNLNSEWMNEMDSIEIQAIDLQCKNVTLTFEKKSA